MFLIAMGFSYTLSRNQNLLLSCKRAVMLLVAGYGMNFLKFVAPVLMGIAPNEFIKAYGWTPPATVDNMLYMMSTGDILQLAGVSLFIMGLANHFAKSKYVPLALAVVIAASTKLVHGTQLGIAGVDYILELLWGSTWNVYFAVFPWSAFIFVGMFFGMWYREKQQDANFIFKQMLIYGISVMTIGGALCLYRFDYHFGDYFHLGPGGTVYLVGFNLIALWLSYKIVSKATHNRLLGFLYYASARVTSIYVIQWVAICWGMGIFGFQQLSTGVIIALIPLSMAVTLGLQRIWDMANAKKKKAVLA